MLQISTCAYTTVSVVFPFHYQTEIPMTSLKHAASVVLATLPLLCNAGLLDDAKEQLRRESEANAIASLGNDYVQEIKRYKANPGRIGATCYLKASENWSMWTGMPKAEFAACDELVKQEIRGIREADEKAIAVAKAERAERRKSMSDVAAKLDEMDERQQDRERVLDRRDAARQAEADEDARHKANQDVLDAQIARSKRERCYWSSKECGK
jgi:hypothetical protein